MVKLGFQIGLEDLVLGLAQLEASELKQVFEQLSARIVAPPPVSRLHQEIVLLKRIKAMIPATVAKLSFRFAKAKITRRFQTEGFSFVIFLSFFQTLYF
jgi:hypothetical protein